MNQAALTPAELHLRHIVEHYGKRTAASKAMAARYRPVFADKSSLGFGFSKETKEICYPLTVNRADGAYLWDIDGNQYTDILLGLGINLFGHNPAFVRNAISEQMASGYAIGPQSPLVGQVATLISELTGLERVTFSNTGTEAVMTAIRIARTATGRRRIALFTNSYHGHLDAALVRAPIAEYARKKISSRLQQSALTRPLAALLQRAVMTGAVPAFAGVSAATASEILVLDYANPRSLDILKSQARDIAAVLVEPVQSRMPELQPRDFLLQLRELTESTGIAMIFDEMVTGFRVAAGGAQQHFGIRADIATYSKITGGGMPLSVIAGAAKFMDHIDGGQWRYGDDSKPATATTFFAGTFTKHPLSLAAALANLQQIKAGGAALYDTLNARTAALVQRLNDTMRAHKLPIELTSFGSFFAIAASRSQLSPQAQLLLSYNLLLRGIHLRIGDKGGFLSTAHTDADIDTIFTGFRDSLQALREAALI